MCPGTPPRRSHVPRADGRGAGPGLAVRDALRSFPGLDHRLKLVADHGGVRYFDDSKSTVPGATRLAVAAVAEQTDPSRIYLIVGGYDKGVDLAPIAALASGLKGLYAIGATASKIAAHGVGVACSDLTQAMQLIKAKTAPGDVVLLSPGCASWDQFANYQERGNLFAQLAVDGAGTEDSCCSQPC